MVAIFFGEREPSKSQLVCLKKIAEDVGRLGEMSGKLENFNWGNSFLLGGWIRRETK